MVERTSAKNLKYLDVIQVPFVSADKEGNIILENGRPKMRVRSLQVWNVRDKGETVEIDVVLKVNDNYFNGRYQNSDLVLHTLVKSAEDPVTLVNGMYQNVINR